MSDRSAIGSGNFTDNMAKVTKEVENILGKYDWNNITPEQRSQVTSSLYSAVQQSVGSTKEQLNQRTGADAGAR
jgi:hypothetical protein